MSVETIVIACLFVFWIVVSIDAYFSAKDEPDQQAGE